MKIKLSKTFFDLLFLPGIAFDKLTDETPLLVTRRRTKGPGWDIIRVDLEARIEKMLREKVSLVLINLADSYGASGVFF